MNLRMQGSDLYDSNTNNRLAYLRGSDIYDSNTNNRIGTLDDARRSIDNAHGGLSVAAFWLLFVR